MKKRNYSASKLALGFLLLSGLSLQAQESQSNGTRAEGEITPVQVFATAPPVTPKSETILHTLPRVPNSSSRSECIETFTKEMTLWVKNNYELFEQLDPQTRELFNASRFEELMSHVNALQTTNIK